MSFEAMEFHPVFTGISTTWRLLLTKTNTFRNAQPRARGGMGCTEVRNAHRRCLRGSGQTQLKEPLPTPAPRPALGRGGRCRVVTAMHGHQCMATNACCHGSPWGSTGGFSPSEYAESTGRGSLNPLCRPGQLCTNKNQGSLPEHVGPQAHRTPGAGVPRESLDKQFCRDSGARESVPRISCDIYRMIWCHTLVSGEIKVPVAQGVTGTPSQAANPALPSAPAVQGGLGWKPAEQEEC